MAPSRIRRALGAVKDQTSISIAKVSSTSSISNLDVAIVKATRHDEYPPEEKYIREILSMTCYSRAHISSCVSSLSRRLGRTRSWTVALKTLILIHRLLSEGDPAYEQEIFFSTRQGTRMLNMSEFRDHSRSDAWDFSAFVRTYAMYLDERLDFRMHGRRARHRSRSLCEEVDEGAAAQRAATVTASSALTPVRDMKLERLFMRTKHLQQLLERFLACRPTGAARTNRIIVVALYPIVKESFQIYFDLQEIMNIFVDRFMDLEITESVRVYETFCRLSKQFEELDHLYNWCKSAGVSRPPEYPTVQCISNKKLMVMDELIRNKSALPLTNTPEPDLARDKSSLPRTNTPNPAPASIEESEPESGPHSLRDLLSQGSTGKVTSSEDEKTTAMAITDQDLKNDKGELLHADENGDFLNLHAQPAEMTKEQDDKLALALFDDWAGVGAAIMPSPWVAFEEDTSDWERALVVSTSALSGQTTSLGRGFDMLLLDGMYNQPRYTGDGFLRGGSASSVAVIEPTMQPMLALPAPPGTEGGRVAADPFAASMAVPAPTYVQMSEMERKQKLLVGEQLMWQQYARDGMQGQLGMSNLQKY